MFGGLFPEDPPFRYISYDGEYTFIPIGEVIKQQQAKEIEQNVSKISALQAAARFMYVVGAELRIRTDWNGEMPYGQG